MDRATRQHRPWRAAAGMVCAAALAAVLAVAGCAAPGSGAGSRTGSNTGPNTDSNTGSNTGSATGSGGSTSSQAPASTTASAPASATASAPAAPLADRVAGRSFVSTSVTGHRLAPGSQIGIQFGRGGDVNWGAGCNSMGGSAHWHGSTLSVDQVISTEMGCARPLMDQDTWFAGLLKSGIGVDLHGDTLTLTGGGATVRFIDSRVVNPDRPLQGTTWILDGIRSGSGPSAAVSSVPPGITATLRIAAGKIHFFDGVNDFDGPLGPGAALTVGPDTVTIHGQIAGSAVGCAPGHTCSVDMSMLTASFHYTITADRLTVTGIGSTAGHGLMFVAQGRSDGGTSGPAMSPPAKRPPIVPPGSITPLPTSAGPRDPLPGRHDSIPPQPSPESAAPSTN